MALAGRDLEAVARVKDKVVTFDFEYEFSFEHEEKLARVNVGVTGLTGTGRHEFFDDAELGGFDEMPTVTVGSLWPSPFVMFGRFCTDDLCWHSSPPRMKS